MFRHFKNSDQINPWTFRQRETSREFHQSSPGVVKPIKSLRQEPKFQSKALRHLKNHFQLQTIRPEISQSEVVNLQSLKFLCSKIPKHSIQSEALADIQRSTPSYKLISFEYRSRPVKRKAKEKKMSFISNSMRLYTEGMEIAGKKEQRAPKEYEKILKVKRYFTEQKDYEDCCSLFMSKELDINEISKTEQVRKPQEYHLKIVKTFKNNSREEIITKGRLFDQVQDICQRKGISGGGHLSTMKRIYNIKKLEKILKQDKND